MKNQIKNVDYTQFDILSFAQKWDKEIKPSINFNDEKYSKYKEDLKKINPYLMGSQVRRKFGFESRREMIPPSEFFIGNNDTEVNFLSNFYNEYDKGWLDENRKISEEEYLVEVNNFIKQIKSLKLIVGETLLYQFKNNKNNWYKVRIEYIHDKKHSVVVMMLDNKMEEVRVVGYGNDLGNFKRIE